MTQPPPQFIDPANPLLAQVPARMDAGTVDLPGGAGTIAIVTIRTASTTMTVMLDKKDLATWADILTGLADSMTGGGTRLAMPSQAEISALAHRNGQP